MRYLVVCIISPEKRDCGVYRQEGDKAILVASTISQDMKWIGHEFDLLENKEWFARRTRPASALYCCLKFGVGL